MGYGFMCDQDLSFLEKLGMFSIWLTFGGLLLFIPGVVLAGLVGLAIKLGASGIEWLLWVGVALMLPTGFGALGYFIFGVLNEIKERSPSFVNYLQRIRSKRACGED